MGETVKILVVDDDCRMVKTICDILEAKGFQALPAFNGEEAVAMVRAQSPDCVLMDVKMPGIDGIEALRLMKEIVPDLPVVLMSAYSTGDQAKEANRRGVYSVLIKPIDIQQLLSFLSLLSKESSILVVADDPSFCKTLRDILQSKEYQVETEDDPGRALALMEQKYVLAVVLDLRLGDADGLKLLRDIRSRYPTKPVLLVAGYREEMAASIEKGLQIGAYACLYKPLVTEELVGIIEEIRLEKRRALLGESFQI